MNLVVAKNECKVVKLKKKFTVKSDFFERKVVKLKKKFSVKSGFFEPYYFKKKKKKKKVIKH